MGATLEFVKYPTQDLEKIKTMFRQDIEDIEQDIISEFEYEYPDEEFDPEYLMYTGTIFELQNIETVYPEVVKTESEAEEIISEKHEKWSGALVVHLEDGSSLVGGWCSC